MHPKTRKKHIKESLPYRRDMYLTANECINAMRILLAFEGGIRHFSTYKNDRALQLLASTALELYAKSIIFFHLTKAGKKPAEISRDIEKFKHDLSKLYSDAGVGKYFCRKVGIRKVTIIKLEGLRPSYGYLFETYGQKNYNDDWYCESDFVVYDPESIRYGRLAKYKAQEGINVWEPNLLIKTCLRVQKETLKEIEIYRVPDTYFKKRLEDLTAANSPKKFQ